MKRYWKLYTACLAMFVMLALGGVVTMAAGENCTTIQITGIYGQTEARTMLDMLNEFRTGSDAWYPNESGQEVRRELQPLTYDYGLEQAAMQRAIELAFSFGTIRPNGQAYRTVPESYYADKEIYGGEIYAAAKAATASAKSASAIFGKWKAADEPYERQISRRSMLNQSLKRVGVGHVFFNGKHYWVMELGRGPTGVAATAPAEGEKTVEIEVANGRVTEKTLKTSVASLSVPAGSNVPLPTVVGSIKTMDMQLTEPVEVTVPCVWTMAAGGESVISISSGAVTGKSAGTTSITTEAFGETITVPVTVTSAGSPSTEGPVIGDPVVETPSPGTPSTEKKKIPVGTQGKVNGAKYRVTKAGVSGKAEAEYMAPTNASKASAVIPSAVTIKGFKCKVTSIAAGAFKNNKKLKSVTIPASVTKIGKRAFDNCRNLVKIVVRSKKLTEKTVGANAFRGVPQKAAIQAPAGKLNAYKKLFRSRGMAQ